MTLNLKPSSGKVAPEPATMAHVPGHDPEEEDIVAHYMQCTPWYVRTRLSAATAAAGVWTKNLQAHGPETTKEKLKQTWTTYGITSALVLGVSYSSSLSPLESPGDSDGKDIAASLAAVFTGVSLMLSLGIVVMTVIYYIEIDNLPTSRDVADFIKSNGKVFDTITGIFSASIVLLCAAALASMYVTYGLTEFLIVAGVTGVLILSGAVFAAVVAGHVRFILWARFESPLALQRAERSAHQQAQKQPPELA